MLTGPETSHRQTEYHSKQILDTSTESASEIPSIPASQAATADDLFLSASNSSTHSVPAPSSFKDLSSNLINQPCPPQKQVFVCLLYLQHGPKVKTVAKFLHHTKWRIQSHISETSVIPGVPNNPAKPSNPNKNKFLHFSIKSGDPAIPRG